MFINQLYLTEVEKRIEKNPDLQAIRIASINPILDPWIYILLRKAVLLKLIQNIKCLFCKVGACRPGQQGGQGAFHCRDGQQLSSIISRDGCSLVSRDLREVSSTSQTLLYLPEGSEGYSWQTEEPSVTEPHRSHCPSRKAGDRASPVSDEPSSHGTDLPPNMAHLSFQTFQKESI